MKISYAITTHVEGTLDDIIKHKSVPIPTLDEVLSALQASATLLSLIASMDKERDGILRPQAARSAALIAALQPKEIAP